jgi:hypothetical protein
MKWSCIALISRRGGLKQSAMQRRVAGAAEAFYVGMAASGINQSIAICMMITDGKPTISPESQGDYSAPIRQAV